MADLPIVYLTDRDLRPVTDPIEYTAIDAVDRHLDPGHGAITCPATDEVMNALALPGRRGVIIDTGQVFLAGPVERPHGSYQWSAGPGGDAGPGQVTWHMANDLALIAGRRTYPDPTLPWESQSESEDASFTTTGPASTVIHTLANVNAGPAALPARRVPHMVMATDPAVGPTLTVQSRFQWLGDELRAAVAASGGAVGFRTTVDLAAREVIFEVFATVDRSRAIRFSRNLGNLRGVSYDSEIPRVTAALVAAQGEGTSRTLIERVDTTAEAAYWRMENLVDRRDSDDTSVIEQAGDTALAEGAAAARLATVTVDSPDQRYGVHFRIGDLVSTEAVPGLAITDVVRAAHLQVTPRSGRLLTAMVGSQELSRDPEWLRQSRELARRLARLEAI